MHEFVAIGFDGGMTFALTGENAGHWVEGKPTHIAIEEVADIWDEAHEVGWVDALLNIGDNVFPETANPYRLDN